MTDRHKKRAVNRKVRRTTQRREGLVLPSPARQKRLERLGYRGIKLEL